MQCVQNFVSPALASIEIFSLYIAHIFFKQVKITWRQSLFVCSFCSLNIVISWFISGNTSVFIFLIVPFLHRCSTQLPVQMFWSTLYHNEWLACQKDTYLYDEQNSCSRTSCTIFHRFNYKFPTFMRRSNRNKSLARSTGWFTREINEPRRIVKSV